MKKLIALTLAVVMLCTVSLAFAKTFEPEGQLAGKTLHATVGAYDPETKTFTVTVYEYDRFGKDTAGNLAAPRSGRAPTVRKSSSAVPVRRTTIP